MLNHFPHHKYILPLQLMHGLTDFQLFGGLTDGLAAKKGKISINNLEVVWEKGDANPP